MSESNREFRHSAQSRANSARVSEREAERRRARVMPAVEASAEKPHAYGRWLIVLFLLSLPLVNPWVRGDGVGYYAYARSLVIDHNLQFEKDWRAANPSFQLARVDSNGNILADQYTRTGHLDNHFSVGPAMLWAPVLIVVDGAVRVADHFGAHIRADGYSLP